MRVLSAGCWALLGLAACSGKRTETVKRDTLTTRERQERISTMPIPGSRGVGRALEVADSGAARAARIDSLQRER